MKLSRAADRKTIKENFKTKLSNLEEGEIRLALKNLYEKIEAKNSSLQDSLFIEDLIEYKDLVKKFLGISVKNSHVFFNENSLDRRGRHRIFSLVKKVNLELDGLTQDFLNIEENRIKILKKLDNISGLLLDILT